MNDMTRHYDNRHASKQLMIKVLVIKVPYTSVVCFSYSRWRVTSWTYQKATRAGARRKTHNWKKSTNSSSRDPQCYYDFNSSARWCFYFASIYIV